MGLGLQGAYGLQGAQGALRQRLIDRMAQEQHQQQMLMERANLDLRTRQIAGQEEDRKVALAERQQANARLGTTALNTELSQLSPETPISGGTQQRMVSGGVLPERMAPIGITPMAPPESLAAVDQPDAGPLPGTMANSPSPAARQYLRVRTAPEQKSFTEETKQADATKRLLANFPAGSPQRTAVEYESATGRNAPAGMFDKPVKPGVIHDTPNGLVRIAEDGTVTPLGVQGYHPPVDTTGRDLRNQILQDKIDAEKTAKTEKESSARSATATALELADRLEKHPGLSMASGYVSSRFADFSQDATDANGIRDQLVAALTLPNLGTLKGPMSDRDVIFVKQLATRLGNPRLSEAETRKALKEAKAFLQSKSDAQGGAKPSGGSSGGDGLSYQDYLNSRKNTK